VCVVRSFGTEDRETAYPIAPQPTVYDYILFRGSDIKDIRVVNNVAIPNDPAIMQMHLPPGQQPNFPPQSYPPMQQAGGIPPFGFGQMGGLSQQSPQQASIVPASSLSQQQSQQGNNNNANNLAPGSGSGKKSSELSNLPSETSNETSSSSTNQQPSTTAITRKQTNKGPGVHSSSYISINSSRQSPLRLALRYDFILSYFAWAKLSLCLSQLLLSLSLLSIKHANHKKKVENQQQHHQ